LNERVYVAASPIHGRGLFAARRLPAGEFIGHYEGQRVDEDGRYVLWVENGNGTGWVGFEGRNEMRYLNHSARPNAAMDGLTCYSLRDIQPDEEITIDYGWEDS
jgi:SET domain-containing protein